MCTTRWTGAKSPAATSPQLSDVDWGYFCAKFHKCFMSPFSCQFRAAHLFRWGHVALREQNSVHLLICIRIECRPATPKILGKTSARPNLGWRSARPCFGRIFRVGVRIGNFFRRYLRRGSSSHRRGRGWSLVKCAPAVAGLDVRVRRGAWLGGRARLFRAVARGHAACSGP